MIKKIVFFYLLSFCVIGFSQNSNTVLWKISGKNLKKPSYLFGTIHLKDKRVFFANDSISYYIKSCDAFANELHPDSLNALIFNNVNKSDTTDLFRKTLNNNDYESINKKLQNDFGISLRQIRNKDFRLLKFLLNPVDEKKDDYPTFLDGYLLGMAKRMDKDIVGLENIGSHSTALKSLTAEEKFKKEVIDLSKTEKNKNSHEELIKLYQAEDIQKIQETMSVLAYETQHDLIYIRNKVMAQTIDSLIKSKTLFATCGAAHLGGDNGIIQLLKDFGYTLTPVLNNKKTYLSIAGLPQNFNSWQTVSNTNFGYKCEFPGSPVAYNKEIMLSDMQMYLDISSGSAYMVMPVTAAVDVSDKEKIYSALLESLKNKSYDKTIKYHKSVTQNGTKGIELCYKTNLKIEARLRVFIEHNILYMFIITYSADFSNNEEFDHFFNSISLSKPVGSDFYKYHNTKWNFSIDLPSKPTEKNEYAKGDHVIELLNLRSSDNVSGIQYIMQLSEAGPGRFFEVDSSILNRMSHYFSGNKSVISTVDSDFVYKGSRCRQSIAKAIDESCLVNWTMLKGYKLYNIMAIMNKSALEKKTYETVLTSINFPELSLNQFKPFKTPVDSLLTISLVNDFEKYKYDDDVRYDTIDPLYQSFDERSGITYYLKKQQESDYYYTESDSIGWNEIRKKIVSYNDTLLYEKNVLISNIPARKFIVKSKESTSAIHYIILNFGKVQYNFYSYLPEHETNETYSYPFQTISYKGSYKKQFYSDTTAFIKLVTDAFSKDTIKKEDSRSEFYQFKLTENMWPQIKQILNSPQDKIDTSGYEFDLKYKLISKLSKLPDSLVFEYIVKKLQDNQTAKKHLIQYASSLAEIKTKSAYSELNLFFKDKMQVLSDYNSVLYDAKDSLDLAAQLFPTLLEAFEKDTTDNYALTRLTQNLLDTGLIAYTMVKPYQSALLNRSKRYASQKSDFKLLFDTYYNETILEILNYSEDKAIIYTHLNDLSKSKNLWASYYGTSYLIENNQPANTKVIASLAKHPYIRHMLYNELKKNNHLNLFPSKYNKQLSLAEAELYTYAYYYDEIQLEKIDFLSVKRVPFKGKDAEFYFFKVKYLDSGDYYLGYCGPYFIGEEISNSGSKTAIFYDEPYTKKMEDIYISTLTE